MSRPGPSLKQRLAALASAPTSTSRAGPSAAGDTEVTRSQHGRKRSFFTPPWMKRGAVSNDGPLSPASEERDRIQDVMGRMIYQAGALLQWRLHLWKLIRTPTGVDYEYVILPWILVIFTKQYSESGHDLCETAIIVFPQRLVC